MKNLLRCVAVLLLATLVGCRTKTGVQTANELSDSLGRSNDGSGRALVRIASPASPVAWLGCEVVGTPCEPIGLIPAGASAHSWEPKPSQLRQLEGIDAWLRTGLSFENAWTTRLQGTFPKLPILDLRGGLDLESAPEDGHGHQHEPMDPHVWASPRAMMVLAETLAVKLSAQRPDLAARIAVGMPRVRQRLDSLDRLARAMLAPWSGRTFLINHPGLGYLARDYGLVQMSLEREGRELSPVDLFNLRKTAKAQGFRAVYIQAEASDRVARSVAADLGVPAIELDLLTPPWDAAFRATVASLAQGL